jgi:hypothetical protein
MSHARSIHPVLHAHGATGETVGEILAYVRSPFDVDAAPPVSALPLEDEPFVADWQRYAERAEAGTAADVLREVLVQLRFPIREGISRTDAYRRATASLHHLRAADRGEGVVFEAPDAVSITLHPTPAGRLPVVRVGARADFERVLQAVTRANEPAPIPRTVGAMMISGYANWDRIARLRRAWRDANPDASDAGWPAFFQRCDPAGYRDRFVLCSSGFYSGVPPADLGLSAAEWRRRSVDLRVAHEATHYATRRLFGSMQNHLYDELLADYFGLVHAVGAYRADWFLRFMGLEEGRDGREGRLPYYRGDPPLSDAAFAVVRRLVRTAANTLAAVDVHLAARRAAERSAGKRPASVPSTEVRSADLPSLLLLALAHHTLLTLAAPTAAGDLLATLDDLEAGASALS